MGGEVYVLGPKNGQIYENGNALFQASKMVFSLLDFFFLLLLSRMFRRFCVCLVWSFSPFAS